MARLTIYTDKVIPQTREYIASCGKEATELPTVEGLAIYLSINRDTITEWRKVHKDFDEIVEELKDKQKNQLINDGLYGGKEVNATMAIFLLKANHGMIETSNLDITSKGRPLIRFDIDGGSLVKELDQPSAQTAGGSGSLIESNV